MKADLHIHTTASDGEYSPKDIVICAKKMGLDLISITDHDTVDGVEEAIITGEDVGIKVLAGIELSCYLNTQIHILGYNVEYKNSEFIKKIKDLSQKRHERNLEIVDKLKALGIQIDYKDVTKYASGESVGRLHIAKALVDIGACRSITQAFDMYIDEGRCAYVPSIRLTPTQAVHLIKEYGGVSVIAHPQKIKLNFSAVEKIIGKLKKEGLDGIESSYFSAELNQMRYFTLLAHKYGLMTTGGSDFHGNTSGDIHMTNLGNKWYTPSNHTLKRLNVIQAE